jgi:endonuclease YncB( thermonuclease family)
MLLRLLLTIFLLGLGPLPAAAATSVVLVGQVSHVSDGDSLWLTVPSPAAPVQLRLLGIDAPEICQPWGPEARQALEELVLHKQVSVRTAGVDSYGRVLGTVYLDGLNINKALVGEGHAWSTRYKHDRGPYVADERMAKALSRGLNRAGGAIMPRDFRRQHGPCHKPAGDGGGTLDARSTTPAHDATTAATAALRCDGRTHCSQMNSCAEATFFLRHCPGVKMDGNGDGVPCEKQWCGAIAR